MCKVFDTDFGPPIVVRGLRAPPSFNLPKIAGHGDPALQWVVGGRKIVKKLYIPKSNEATVNLPTFFIYLVLLYLDIIYYANDEPEKQE